MKMKAFDNMSSVIHVYTDGSCIGNGTASAIGGWAAVLANEKQQLRITGHGGQTTNNRMELQAAIEGLRAVSNVTCPIHLYTDSKYVQQGCESWLAAWKLNGWRTSSKKPVKNVDLWKQLDEQLLRLCVTLHWIRGHNGHPMNELVDQLAMLASRSKAGIRERRNAGDVRL